MHPKFNAEFVQKALSRKDWDFGNEVLYELCENHPYHKNKGQIIAKIWLIGRAYSAAIERRRKTRRKGYTPYTGDGDSFYEDHAAPIIRKFPIDIWFRKLTKDKEDRSNELTLEIHKRLTDLFRKVSGLEKRSLASKYLHFHFRDRYYIYDARANTALVSIYKKLGKTLRKDSIKKRLKYDADYAKFFLRCQELKPELDEMAGKKTDPRDLDKVLLEWERQSKKRRPNLSTRKCRRSKE